MNFYLLFILSNLFSGDAFFYNYKLSYKQICRKDKNKQIYKMDNDNDEDKVNLYKYGNNPRLEYPNDNGQLTWYPIGFKKDFGKQPKRVTIRDNNYVVWRDSSSFYALKDCCSHQGSSFIQGETCKNTISCPYHGYVFDGNNGNLVDIPKLPHVVSHSQNIFFYKVVEKADIIYLNTIPLINEDDKKLIDESKIFVESEYFNKEQRAVYLSEDFEHNAKFVSVNSLDICHIGFVHTFGNRKNPNPLYNSKIEKIDDYDFHYKITYNYIAGEKSLVNKIYNFNKIKVENEYLLPHTTVARVCFGDYNSTIITYALPISKFKTKLFVKAYRNYWAYSDNYNLNSIINFFGDKVTKNTMYTTLKQDKLIIDHIDKKNYNDMHGKFSIIYDMFSNHYKLNYKRYYEEGYDYF